MRSVGTFLLAVSLGTGAGLHATEALAAKGKKKGEEAAPKASVSEVNKLKAVRFGDPKAGSFKWGLKPEEVEKLISVQIERKYQARVDQAKQDPGKQQRIRDEREREVQAVKKSFTKFEGAKTG